MNKCIEYVHEIKEEYLKNSEIFVYYLDIDYSEIIDVLYEVFAEEKTKFKINSIRDIPYNLKKVYPEYGFFVDKNKIYSVSELSEDTLSSMIDSLKDKLIRFINDEHENLKNLDLNIDDIFKDNKLTCEKKTIYELNDLRTDKKLLYKNILKAKNVVNICSKPIVIPYRVKVNKSKDYKVMSREFTFTPIHGRSGEVFSSEFFEAKNEKGVMKIKIDVKEEGEKLLFEYTMSFSEIIKHPVKYSDLYANAWKDKPKHKKRTFYSRVEDRYIPLNIKRVYNRDKEKYPELSEFSFMFEYNDFLISSEIEHYLGYNLEDINQLLLSEGTENKVFLQNWSQASRKKPFGGGGLTFHDKYCLSKHILSTNNGLSEFKSYPQCEINNKKAFKSGIMKREKSATTDNGVILENIMLKKTDVKEINLYIFKDSTKENAVDIVNCVKSVLISPEKTIKASLSNTIISKVDKYKLAKSKVESEDMPDEETIGKMNKAKDDVIKNIEAQNKNIQQEKIKNENSRGCKFIDKNKYLMNIVDVNGENRDLLLNIHIIDDEDALDETYSTESVEERLSVIKKAIGGDFKENSMAIIELDKLDENNKSVDSKSIIRKALNSVGVVNQFINPIENEAVVSSYLSTGVEIVDYDFENDEFKYEEIPYLQKDEDNKYCNKVRKAILDLFNDFGFTDSTFAFNEYTLYSFGVINHSGKIDYSKTSNEDLDDDEDIEEVIEEVVIDKEGIYIPVITKMTDDNILVRLILDNPTDEFDKWVHISKLPELLFKLRSQLSKVSSIERFNLSQYTTLSSSFEKIAKFIEDDNTDNKIVLLSHKNCGKLDFDAYKSIFKKVLNCTTIFTEIENTNYSLMKDTVSIEGFETFTLPNNFLYKVDENIYKSIGLKPFGIKMLECGYSKVNPLNNFKCRKIFKIEILNNKTMLNNELLSYLIFKTRTSLTTNIPLNLDILTEHIYSSINKHFLK